MLSHNRYTLLDRSAQGLFRDAHARGLGVLNAAPYGGGMLVKGPETVALAAVPIPDALWAELDALAPSEELWLG